MRLTSSKARVIVFAKAPHPGRAKTRLITRLGAEGAAALQARLIEHTLSTVKRAGFRDVQLYGSPAADPFLRFCAERYRAELIEQSEGDLGARMQHAFESAAGARNTLLIGTDCPALAPSHLAQAARTLTAGTDVVLVPVEDGGYSLIGLARSDRRLFEGIHWGTPQVLGQTRARLRELGWRWRELQTLWDVDTPSDYERLLASGLLEENVLTSGVRPTKAAVIDDNL